MKTVSYNGSRKAYLCPAINITDIEIEQLICQSPYVPQGATGGGDDNGSGIAETKRRRGIFDEGGDVADSKGIW